MTKYLEIEWYGRTGEEVLSTAAVLAEVLAVEGKYVQTFPGYSSEKNCAFFQAYNRLSDSPVRIHSAITAADIIVIMDPNLILNTDIDIKTNAKENAVYLVNTSAPTGLIKEKLAVPGNHIFTLDTSIIAREESGNGNSIPNVPLMTVIIGWIDWIPIDTFKQRLRESMSHTWTPDRAAAKIKSVDRAAQEFKKSNNLASINNHLAS